MAIVDNGALLGIYQDLVFDAASGASFGFFFDLTDNSETFTLSPDLLQENPAGVRALGGSDAISGSVATDVVNGNAGFDSLDGDSGDDYLRGGRDDDLIGGDEGRDVVNGNIGTDYVSGGTGDDFVRGGQGDDVLVGDLGNDVLIGDFGRDTLEGGEGSDTFVFRADSEQQLDPFEADFAIDFNPFEGDRILIAGDFNSSDLVYEAIDILGAATVDVIIRRFSTGHVLAVVQDAVDPSNIDLDTSIVPLSDPALALG